MNLSHTIMRLALVGLMASCIAGTVWVVKQFADHTNGSGEEGGRAPLTPR